MTPNELGDTPLSPDDPIQSSLIQMFLSELQTHTPSEPQGSEGSEALIGLGVSGNNPELELEWDSASPSVPSSLVPTSPPSLECMPTNSFTGSIDDPFLNSFTDISLLQERCPLLSGGRVKSVPPVHTTPQDSDVNVTVVKSSECDANSATVNQEVFDLSDCVNYLTSTPSTLTSPPLSPTTSLSTATSPASTNPQHLLLCDFDFTAITDQDMASIVSHLSSATTPDSPLSTTSDTPSLDGSLTSTFSDAVPSSDVFTSHEASPSNDGKPVARKSRKRKVVGSSSDLPAEKASKVIHQASSELSVKEKCKIRRDKNNKASQVSRAKRRQRGVDMSVRAEELVEENARLRVQVEELTAETQTLKRLLVERLAQ